MSSLTEPTESKDTAVVFAFEVDNPHVWEYLEYPKPTILQRCGVSRLFSHSLFIREWVFQEMILASRLRIFRGKAEMPLKALLSTALFLYWNKRAQSLYWLTVRLSKER